MEFYMKRKELQRRYMEAVLRANERVNLTAIRDEDEFLSKHIADSVSCTGLPEFSAAERICDVGTGGGFPGVPLAIEAPGKSFVLLDSTAKKLKVIQEITAELGIENVATLHARAEEAAHDAEHREQYDMVVSRAVAELNILCEWCLPLVRVGGVFVAYKGARAAHEAGAAANAIKRLGGKLLRFETVRLEDAEKHHLVVIAKVSATPGMYPRNAGAAKKKPL